MNTEKNELLIAEIERFKAEAIKMHFVKCWAESYKTDPFGYSVDSENRIFWMKAQAGQLWDFWRVSQANTSPKGQLFFSHDFNGDGFKYHNTLEEAKREANSNLDWYRDQVADGRHVNDMGEFNELSYGLVIGSAEHSVERVVTQDDIDKGESKYEVGTEILSLYLSESQEPCHDR